MYLSVLTTADPEPPTSVSINNETGCDSAEVSWMASVSMFDSTIMNYSVRYQVTSGTGAHTTVHTTNTSITLQGLTNAEYNVSVAGINSCGGTSPFVVVHFQLQGN